MNNFQLQQAVVSSEAAGRMKTLTYKAEDNLLLLGCKKLEILEFDNSHSPKLTDDQPITGFQYSEINQEFYLISGRSLKIWDARKGVLSRNFKNLTEKEITAISLDKTNRNIFIGSSDGKIM